MNSTAIRVNELKGLKIVENNSVDFSVRVLVAAEKRERESHEPIKVS